jgi:hypothetical protein
MPSGNIFLIHHNTSYIHSCTMHKQEVLGIVVEQHLYMDWGSTGTLAHAFHVTTKDLPVATIQIALPMGFVP